jgi:hypothetical protein
MGGMKLALVMTGLCLAVLLTGMVRRQSLFFCVKVTAL